MTTTRTARHSALTEDQYADLMTWRSMALERMPYFASILFALRPLDTPGMGTFAVDKRLRLYIDFDAVREWGNARCAEALLHEAGHVYREHSDRAEEHGIQPEHHMHWNIAGDMVINQDLHDAGVTSPGANGVLPGKYGLPEGQTTEQYFDALMRKHPPQPQKQAQQQSGQGQGDDGQRSGQGQQDGQGQKPKPFNGCGSGSGGTKGDFELEDGDDAGGAAPGASDAERRAVQIETAAAIREASQTRGSVPAGLVDEAEQVLAPPKVDWRKVLSSSIRRTVATKMGDFDIDFARRHRRRHRVEVAPGKRVVYPGTYSPVPMVTVVRDTSGSMGRDEMETVTNEVVGISKSLGIRGKELRYIDTDADAYEAVNFRDAAQMGTIRGGGGTDMRVGIAAAVEAKPVPTIIVCITDGYTPWPEERTPVPLVICLVGRGAERLKDSTPPWAITVVVDD